MIYFRCVNNEVIDIKAYDELMTRNESIKNRFYHLTKWNGFQHMKVWH